MTNLECVVDVLARHREARQWTDAAVAADVLSALGLDPMADAHAAAEALALVEKAKAPVVVEAPDAPWMADPDAGQMQAANEAHMASVEVAPAAEPFQSATQAEPLSPPLPDHVAEALHVAQTPGISDAEREAAVRVLLNYEAEHKPAEDGPDPQKVAAEAFAREQAKEGEAHE